MQASIGPQRRGLSLDGATGSCQLIVNGTAIFDTNTRHETNNASRERSGIAQKYPGNRRHGSPPNPNPNHPIDLGVPAGPGGLADPGARTATASSVRGGRWAVGSGR